jgi:hypothetical protein
MYMIVHFLQPSDQEKDETGDPASDETDIRVGVVVAESLGRRRGSGTTLGNGLLGGERARAGDGLRGDDRTGDGRGRDGRDIGGDAGNEGRENGLGSTATRGIATRGIATRSSRAAFRAGGSSGVGSGSSASSRGAPVTTITACGGTARSHITGDSRTSSRGWASEDDRGVTRALGDDVQGSREEGEEEDNGELGHFLFFFFCRFLGGLGKKMWGRWGLKKKKKKKQKKRRYQ